MYHSDESAINDDNIEAISVTMNICIALLGIILVFPWIVTLEGEQIFQYGTGFWLMATLVGVNRFFILPKYREILIYQKQNKQAGKPKEENLLPKWVCKKCGEENSPSSYHCINCSESR